LHEGLLESGVDSWVLCQQKQEVEPKVVSLYGEAHPFAVKLKRRISRQFVNFQKDPTCFAFSLNFIRNRALEKIKDINLDLIHLHWVGGDFLRIEDLPSLQVPIVWTLHDMWPFCGAEHVAYQNDRWENGYTRSNRSPE